MPTYELALLLRVMPREEIFSCLKRTSTAIFNTGGFIRKISNLGKQPTPYKITADFGPHREANYFVIEFEGAPHDLDDLNKLYKREIDIMRYRIYRAIKSDAASTSCTLDDELKPPAYRKEVQEMIAMTRRARSYKPKSAWAFNMGLDYYPFQR